MAAVEVSAVDWVDDVGTVDGEQAAIGVDWLDVTTGGVQGNVEAHSTLRGVLWSWLCSTIKQ